MLGKIQKGGLIILLLFIKLSKSFISLKVRLYIYGGQDIREGSFSDLWRFDLAKSDDLDKTEEEQIKLDLNVQYYTTMDQIIEDFLLESFDYQLMF